MRTNRVKALWRAGEPVVTGWCSLADPVTTEIMARAGFDALVLDMQHGMTIGPERAAVWLQIVGQTEVVPIVRIPWNEPFFAQWVLDAGAMGVIIPMVNNLADAQKAIGACRYPPIGYRSNGPNRANMALGQGYFAGANQEIICLAMMETAEAVENIEAIANLPGLDGYYIGPTDLAISMGLTPQLDHPAAEHAAAVQKVIDVARAHGQVAGIHVTGPEENARRWKQGFNLNPICGDAALLNASVRRAVAENRELLGK